MSWRDSGLKDRCHDCKEPIHGLAYVGELTPSIWCESCAATTLGRTPDGTRAPSRETGMDRMTAEGLHRLLMKHAPAAAKTWGERDE